MSVDETRSFSAHDTAGRILLMEGKRMLSTTLEEGLRNYEIGEKVRALRLRKKMALVELGRHTGLSAALLSKIERSNIYPRSEEHTSELQSQSNLVCRLLLEKKKKNKKCTAERQAYSLLDIKRD